MGKKTIIRLLRNIFIVAITVSWLLPFMAFVGSILGFLRRQEAELKVYEDSYPHGPCVSNIVLSEWFLMITIGMFGVALIFWMFVLTNKLWPIQPKQEIKD